MKTASNADRGVFACVCVCARVFCVAIQTADTSGWIDADTRASDRAEEGG